MPPPPIPTVTLSAAKAWFVCTAGAAASASPTNAVAIMMRTFITFLRNVLAENVSVGLSIGCAAPKKPRWTAHHRDHRFDQICREHGIEHRLTKPNHPWTNGQVERMNRTIKD